MVNLTTCLFVGRVRKRKKLTAVVEAPWHDVATKVEFAARKEEAIMAHAKVGYFRLCATSLSSLTLLSFAALVSLNRMFLFKVGSALGDGQLFLKLNSNSEICVDVNSLCPVRSLKDMIFAKYGIPASMQSLTSGGQLLFDERTLGDYNIRHESTVKVGLHARGGMQSGDGGGGDVDGGDGVPPAATDPPLLSEIESFLTSKMGLGGANLNIVAEAINECGGLNSFAALLVSSNDLFPTIQVDTT